MRKVEILRILISFLLGWIASHWFLHLRAFDPHVGSGRFAYNGNFGESLSAEGARPKWSNPSDEQNGAGRVSAYLERTGGFKHHGAASTDHFGGRKPSWHRLLDCSVFAFVDCFASPGAYSEYPHFDAPWLLATFAQPPEVAGDEQNKREHFLTDLERTLKARVSGESPGRYDANTGSSAEVAKLGACPGSAVTSPADAYEASLAALARDARRSGSRAAFTLSDASYARSSSSPQPTS